MFAIIETGGKQYKIEKDSIIRIEKINGVVGETIEINEVLLAQNGSEMLNASEVRIKAEILEQKKDKKVIIFKKKRRANYRRKAGHRQPLTVLKVRDIIV